MVQFATSSGPTIAQQLVHNVETGPEVIKKCHAQLS